MKVVMDSNKTFCIVGGYISPTYVGSCNNQRQESVLLGFLISSFWQLMLSADGAVKHEFFNREAKMISVGEGQKNVDFIVAYCQPKATKQKQLYGISVVLKLQWVSWLERSKKTS